MYVVSGFVGGRLAGNVYLIAPCLKVLAGDEKGLRPEFAWRVAVRRHSSRPSGWVVYGAALEQRPASRRRPAVHEVHAHLDKNDHINPPWAL